MTAIETTGSGLIAALEQTRDQPQPPPQLPEVVVLTGTSLSPSAVHLDATGATSAPTTGSKAAPPNTARAPPSTGRRPAAGPS